MMRMKGLLLLLCAVMLLSRASGQCSRACPQSWTSVSGRCFRFIGRPLTWTQAEKNCLSMKGNLASVHTLEEYHQLQSVILQFAHESKPAWIGGSDAAE
ncbi:C-type lectin domain-containing protein, partial [Nematolebias whitei]|uniref:C-type lectin domain-containing protein n=1 Tax=Nematolebias whitei TaxID=451745 RepID=UPI00189A28E0